MSVDPSQLDELRGKTLRNVARTGDEIVFETDTGDRWEMVHHGECCETVHIHDIVGDLQDLVGSPVVMAEVSTNSDGKPLDDRHDSFTWTFYKIATAKGYVTISWYGESNGYYTETAGFYRR